MVKSKNRNLKFCELTEKEFSSFASNKEQSSYMQTIEISELRKVYGSKIFLAGMKENNKIVAGAMISITNTMFGKKSFYSPRGYILDYSDYDLLKEFTEKLSDYAKKNNALFIKIDPNVIYQLRDSNANLYEDQIKNDEIILNLKRLGYHHYGFNKDFEFTQCRWNYRLKLDVPYDELKKGFSKSTRKNIESTYKKGIKVRIATRNDLNSMQEILNATGERKNFNFKSIDYFTNLYDKMGDLLRIYIAYIEPINYLNCCEKMLAEAEKEYEDIQLKMKKDMIGTKLKNQEISAKNKIEKLKEELKVAKDFKKKYPNGKDIGVLVSLKSGLEYLTLYSGYLVEFKYFTPKYAMYNEHILDAYKFNMKYANFYGISGVFDPKDKNYGMYEFKKGFGGEVVELIGEFSYPVSKLYYIYNIIHKAKILLKKLKQKFGGKI